MKRSIVYCPSFGGAKRTVKVCIGTHGTESVCLKEKAGWVLGISKLSIRLYLASKFGEFCKTLHLMARVLKARYFPDCSILEAVQKKKASYTWKSILYGKELIVQGMKFVIGNGTYANMWTDPWIPDHPPRPPRALTTAVVFDCKVKDYFREGRNEWNEKKLREDVVAEDVDRILRLKLSPQAHNDLLGWHYNEDGLYTVKSGNWVASHLPQQTQVQPTYGDAALKHRLWKTKTPPKIKLFVWNLLSKSLATGDNLRRRHVIQQAQCQRCGLEDETDLRLFFTCPYAQCVWRGSGISNLIITSTATTLQEK